MTFWRTHKLRNEVFFCRGIVMVLITEETVVSHRTPILPDDWRTLCAFDRHAHTSYTSHTPSCSAGSCARASLSQKTPRLQHRGDVPQSSAVNVASDIHGLIQCNCSCRVERYFPICTLIFSGTCVGIGTEVRGSILATT